MNKHRIFETEQIQKDLIQISKSGNPIITQKLRDFVYPRLRQHPHFDPNIRKLKDFHPEIWRYRISAWRFFYEIDEESHIVFMTTASHRGSAY